MKRRRLGQHYLVDPSVVSEMVAAARIGQYDRVLEIGTGKGTLTKELAGLGASLEGFEVDPQNYSETLASVGGKGVRLHQADAFREWPGFDILVSSLPYSRSASFVEWLSQIEFRKAVVLLQVDFVNKILAEPGSRDYRAVSTISQISSEVKTLMRVERASFSPPPKVGSMLVSIEPRRRLSKNEVARIKTVFSLRRRKVDSALNKLGINGKGKEYGSRRVYSLVPEEVLEICADARQDSRQ